MQLTISTAWMYLSDDQKYNTIPPEWSDINFKDVDVLNIGPAGVQADGTFGLYNSSQQAISPTGSSGSLRLPAARIRI